MLDNEEDWFQKNTEIALKFYDNTRKNEISDEKVTKRDLEEEKVHFVTIQSDFM